MAIELFNSNTTHGKIVALILDAKHLAFDTHVTPSPFAVNFLNEVTLKDGDHTLHGTEIICSYISEKYPYPALTPAEPERRGIVRMLLRSLLTSEADNPFDFGCYKDKLQTQFLTGKKPGLLDIAIAATAPDTPFWAQFRSRLYTAFNMEPSA